VYPRSWGVGPGKRFTKAELDKKYSREDEQSGELQLPESELQLPEPELQVPEQELQAPEQEMQVPEPELRFPQGSTGATFKAMLEAESFVPKFERSKTRKWELMANREETTAVRKKRAIDATEAKEAKLQAVKDERAPHKCHACGTGYKRQGDLEGHVCNRIADANNNVNDDGKKVEPFQKPVTIPLQECDTPVPLMGHGLVMHRNQNYLTDAVRNLLELEFQKGVANAGSRKGVLEMVETCCKMLPVLMIPSIQAVSSWLAVRLQKKAPESTSRKKRNKPKSVSEMRQWKADVLAREHLPLVKDSTRGNLFLAKYRDVLLIKEGVTRIITSVQFDET
jgi:hypothetical protein